MAGIVIEAIGLGSMTMLELLTLVLVSITAFYAWSNFRILKANENVVSVMQAQHESMTRPYIIVRAFTDPGNPIIFLEIRNTGLTAATDLRLTLDRDFYQFGERPPQGRNLTDANAFQYPIESFPPGATLNFYLATGQNIFGEGANQDLTPGLFKVTARYSYTGKTVTEATAIDLKQFLGTRLDETELTQNLKEIKKALGGITSAIERHGAQT